MMNFPIPANALKLLIVLIMFMTACTPFSTPVITSTNSPAPVIPANLPSTSTHQKATPQEHNSKSGKEPMVEASPAGPLVTSTPETIPIDLPEWVKDPDNDLFLFTYDTDTTRATQIGFLNPNTGEQAIVRLPHPVYQYEWKDSNHIVFLLGKCYDAPKDVTELDISQGNLIRYPINAFPDIEKICNASTEDDPQETSRLDTNSSEPTVEIVDPASGKWVRLTDPNDDISDITFEFSPNEDYVAVVQKPGDYHIPELWQPLFGRQVSVYHLPDRKLLATFTEERDISDNIKFTDNENLVYVREDTPCVISILALSKNCIHNVPNKIPGATIIPGEPLPDRRKLGFMYFGSSSEHQSGFCFYDLFSGELDCPTDKFDILNGNTILTYALSPNMKNLAIEYDYKGCPVPWCDYAGDPQLAVVNLDQGQIYELGSSEIYQALDIMGGSQPWRPRP